MAFIDPIVYVCALRAKPGELNALAMLRHDVADRLLPRLIIAPAKESNKAQLNLLSDRGQLNLVPDLRGSWAYRPAIVDVAHVLDQFGRNSLDKWLAPAIREAAQAGSSLFPCIRSNDLTDELLPGFKLSVDNALGFFALSVNLLDATDPDILSELVTKLTLADLDPARCILLADFIADFSNAEAAAPVLEYAFSVLADAAPWYRIVFQSSAYPEKNPADENSAQLVTRGELLSFEMARSIVSGDAPGVLYGDFGADSSKISFGPSKGRSYPHLRYALHDAWIVVRGSGQGKFNEQMKKVARHIVESRSFSGAGFSEADFRIQNIADGVATAGNASDWRSLNMCHHITMVVDQMGSKLGYALETRVVAGNPVQIGMALVRR